MVKVAIGPDCSTNKVSAAELVTEVIANKLLKGQKSIRIGDYSQFTGMTGNRKITQLKN
jgi:hypothetical protein